MTNLEVNLCTIEKYIRFFYLQVKVLLFTFLFNLISVIIMFHLCWWKFSVSDFKFTFECIMKCWYNFSVSLYWLYVKVPLFSSFTKLVVSPVLMLRFALTRIHAWTRRQRRLLVSKTILYVFLTHKTYITC